MRAPSNELDSVFLTHSSPDESLISVSISGCSAIAPSYLTPSFINMIMMVRLLMFLFFPNATPEMESRVGGWLNHTCVYKGGNRQ